MATPKYTSELDSLIAAMEALPCADIPVSIARTPDENLFAWASMKVFALGRDWCGITDSEIVALLEEPELLVALDRVGMELLARLGARVAIDGGETK